MSEGVARGGEGEGDSGMGCFCWDARNVFAGSNKIKKNPKPKWKRTATSILVGPATFSRARNPSSKGKRIYRRL